MSIPGFRKGYCTGVDKSSRFLERLGTGVNGVNYHENAFYTSILPLF